MGGTMCKIRGQGREDFEGEGAKIGTLHRASTGRCRGRDSQRLRIVGEGHAPPGGAPAQETGYHEIRKRQRFVIARALCARGNLAVPGCIVGKLPAKSQLPSRDCHVASLLAMTIRGAFTVLTIVCQFRRCSAGSGMPLPYSGICGRRGATKPGACMAFPERRYTPYFGAYRFNGSQCGTAVPPRDCHVASLLAMTNLEALTAHIASLHGGHCPMDKSDIPGFARSDIFLSESDIKASRLL